MKIIKSKMVCICMVILLSMASEGCSKIEKVSDVSSIETHESEVIQTLKPESVNTETLKEEEVQKSFPLENYELEFKNGSRLFRSEVTAKSESEALVAEILKIEVSDNYDKFTDLYVQSEQFNHFPRVYKEQFEQGLYAEEIIIHSLKPLSKEEYSGNSNTIQYYTYMNRLNEFKPYEFQIIEINYTVKFTEEKSKNAQWGNGDWTRYYVVVKQGEKSNWRVFDIYGHM